MPQDAGQGLRYWPLVIWLQIAVRCRAMITGSYSISLHNSLYQTVGTMYPAMLLVLIMEAPGGAAYGWYRWDPIV